MVAETLVVRWGAMAIDLPTWRDRAAAELASLHATGKHIVVVHAGGARVDEMLARLGARPAFERGHARASAEAFQVAEMAADAAGKDIAAALQRHGPRALGLSGRDAGLLRARRAGKVALGEVEGVHTDSLRALLEDGFLPVLTAIGASGGEGVLLRAEDAAVAVAVALQPSALVLLGTEDGIAPHGQRVPKLGSHEAQILLAQGALAPSAADALRVCVRAVEQGVAHARVVDVREAGALARAPDPAQDVGTLVIPSRPLDAVRALPR
jgi:acetylglutamate kinase